MNVLQIPATEGEDFISCQPPTRTRPFNQTAPFDSLAIENGLAPEEVSHHEPMKNKTAVPSTTQLTLDSHGAEFKLNNEVVSSIS